MKKLLVTSALVFSLFEHDVLSIEVRQDAAKKISNGISLCKNKIFVQARDCLCDLLIDNINYREKTGLYNLSHKDEARVRLYCAESLRSDGNASAADWVKIELILGALFRGKSPPFEEEEEFPSRSQSRRYHDDSELKTTSRSQPRKYYDDLLESKKYHERSYKPHRSQSYLNYNDKLKSFEQKKEGYVFYDPLFKDNKIIRNLLTAEELLFAQIYYAEALIHLKCYKEAIDILPKMRASQLFPATTPYIHLLFGSAACQLGDFQQAEAHFLQLFNHEHLPASLSPSHAAMARLYYGKTLYELGKFGTAELIFHELFPKEVTTGQTFIDPKVSGFDLLHPEQQAIAIFSRAMALKQLNKQKLCLKVFQRFTHKHFELLDPEQEALARLNYGTILLQRKPDSELSQEKLYSDAHQIFSCLYSKLEENWDICYRGHPNLLKKSEELDARYNYALTSYYTGQFESSIRILSDLHRRISHNFIRDKDLLWFNNVRFFYGKALYATKDFKGAAKIFSEMGGNALGTAMGRLYNALSRYQSGELDGISDILSELCDDPHLSFVEKSLARVCFGVLECKTDYSNASLIYAFNKIFENHNSSTDKEIVENTISELCSLMMDDVFNVLFKSPNEIADNAEVQEGDYGDVEVLEGDDNDGGVEMQEDNDDKLSPVGGTMVRSPSIASGSSSFVQPQHRANAVFAPSPLAQSHTSVSGVSPLAQSHTSVSGVSPSAPYGVRIVSPSPPPPSLLALTSHLYSRVQPTSVGWVLLAAPLTEKVINILLPRIRSLTKEYLALELCKRGRYSDTAKVLEEFFDDDGNYSSSCSSLSDRARTRACYIKALRGIGNQTKADILSAVFYKRTASSITEYYTMSFKSLPVNYKKDLVNFRGVTIMN